MSEEIKSACKANHTSIIDGGLFPDTSDPNVWVADLQHAAGAVVITKFSASTFLNSAIMLNAIRDRYSDVH